MDDGCTGMAAVLSDSSAVYISNDSSNVYRGLIAKNTLNNKLLAFRSVAINPLHKLLTYGCKK